MTAFRKHSSFQAKVRTEGNTTSINVSDAFLTQGDSLNEAVSRLAKGVWMDGVLFERERLTASEDPMEDFAVFDLLQTVKTVLASAAHAPGEARELVDHKALQRLRTLVGK